MPFLSTGEITSHLYGEVTAEISRGDNTLLQEAIDAAIEEAEGYLSQYDTTAIWASTGNQRNKALLVFLKDIAVWHYIQLANPSVDMELRSERYKGAVKWLEKVQCGKVTPKLPYPTIEEGTARNNYIKYGGIAPRNNNF